LETNFKYDLLQKELLVEMGLRGQVAEAPVIRVLGKEFKLEDALTEARRLGASEKFDDLVIAEATRRLLFTYFKEGWKTAYQGVDRTAPSYHSLASLQVDEIAKLRRAQEAIITANNGVGSALREQRRMLLSDEAAFSGIV
jgi:hypothetical protein